ncbi:MAG: GNAT family N-acetyltransferase [Clostridia bacterium]|nr:GNAT family N-acetyltransferase [Clostridia bacterium]
MLVKTSKYIDDKKCEYEVQMQATIDEQNCFNISHKENDFEICKLKAFLNEDNALVLINVWVDPDYRKLGLGSALMKAADYFAYENGANKIEGYFTPENNRAKFMYQHYGYDIEENGDLKIVKDGGKDGENFTKYNSDIIEEEYDQIMLDEVVM